jgi:hypothetical protein
MNSERSSVVILWVIAAACFIVVSAGLVFGWNAAVRDAPTAEVTVQGEMFSILWLGDIMLADGAMDSIGIHGYDWPFRGVVQHMRADFVIANAEAPITALSEQWDDAQRWSYHMLPDAMPAIKRAGIHALGMANNHILDRGPAGLAETITLAEQAGLLTFGAGQNESEAELPLILRSDVGTVGVVALGNYYGRSKTALRDQAGTLPLNKATIRRGYRLAKRAGADWVIGYAHWGSNYEGVTEQQRRVARMFAEEGYTMVIGHHPHVTQEVELIDGMPVAFSLGNFVFGAPGRFAFHRKPGVGLMLKTHFTDGGLQRITLLCIDVDNHRIGYQPQPCSVKEATSVVSSLHSSFLIQGDSAVLQIPDPEQLQPL